MSKNEDFIACVPHQIEADWDEKWGALLAGFPVNIMYACVQRAGHMTSAPVFSSLDGTNERANGSYRLKSRAHCRATPIPPETHS